MTFNGGQEVGWDQGASLMHQLVEGVLTIGSWLTEDDGSGAVGHRIPIKVNGFAVALHVALLQIGGQEFKVLVIGKNGVGVCSEKVVVPDA